MNIRVVLQICKYYYEFIFFHERVSVGLSNIFQQLIKKNASFVMNSEADRDTRFESVITCYLFVIAKYESVITCY